MSATNVLRVFPLGSPPWPTLDPFLFCVWHLDDYPAGNKDLGPAASLEGRSLGQDFAGKDNWRMYHGETVPGFPQHPHRGFETVTVARRGFIDHSDSLGGRARYGRGDVQWMTAGKGVVHSEMFPLLDATARNPLELFQIWLNLPAKDKMSDPHVTMLWSDGVPAVRCEDNDGRVTDVTVVAGDYGDARPGAPPPRSWASQPGSDVAIWTLRMDPGATWTLPPALAGSNRVLYFFRGGTLSLGEQALPSGHAAVLRPEVAQILTNGAEEGEVLLLQGRPIAEPVVAYGPFVMNSRAEIERAFADYQRTRFGGWPWKNHGPVHGTKAERFLDPGALSHSESLGSQKG